MDIRIGGRVLAAAGWRDDGATVRASVGCSVGPAVCAVGALDDGRAVTNKVGGAVGDTVGEWSTAVRLYV